MPGVNSSLEAPCTANIFMAESSDVVCRDAVSFVLTLYLPLPAATTVSDTTSTGLSTDLLWPTVQ